MKNTHPRTPASSGPDIQKAPVRRYSVIQAVQTFLKENPACRRLLVAYSGGPDSTALLESLYRLREEFKLELHACWVNHALRSPRELQEERVFVEKFCDTREIPLVIFEAWEGQIRAAGRKAENGGIEAAARDFRHACLEKARVESGCDSILLAHMQDDVLETMVMRFFTGSGTGGLRGIAASAGRLVRPLLGIHKKDILGFLESESLAYRVDSTNEQQEYLRNRVRHSLIPAIASVFPNVDIALASSARKASLDDDALNAYARDLLLPAALPPFSPYMPFRIPCAAFYDAAPAVRIRALYLVARHYSPRIPWNFMYNAACNNKTSGLLAEGAGISIYSDRGSIWVRTVEGNDASASYDFIAGTFGDYTIGKELTFGLYCSSASSGSSVSFLRTDSFSWPLNVHGVREADVLLTKSGPRKVSGLLTDLKIPRAQLGLVPVVEDGRGVVAVLGRLCGSRDVFRYNGEIEHCESPSFLSVELKGAVFNDGI